MLHVRRICKFSQLKIPSMYSNLQQVNMYDGLRAIKTDLREIFKECVSSVLPQSLIRQTVTIHEPMLRVGEEQYTIKNNCYVVGFGKAVLGMAVEIHNILGHHIVRGILSIPINSRNIMQGDFETIQAAGWEIIEGAKNNIPDESAQQAAEKIAGLAEQLNENSLLIVLISGGGSALLPLPKKEITLQEKQNIIKLLGSVGANITEMNCVRRKLSSLKGGGLAKLAYPAKVISLILSDVVGDPLDSIASGPTIVNTDFPFAALNIIQKYNLQEKTPLSILKILQSNEDEDSLNCIPTNNNKSNYLHVQNVIIGNNKIAVQSAAKTADKLCYHPIILSSEINDTVKNVSNLYAHLSLGICKVLNGQISHQKFMNFLQKIVMENKLNSKIEEDILSGIFSVWNKKGICIISGGETTVVVKGAGIGGRNQELALCFAKNWNDILEKNLGIENFTVVLLSAGTDGIDGPTKAAGAIGYVQQIEFAKEQNLLPDSFLDNNDSNTFYSLLSGGADLIITGHTGTNVMDLHILLIQPPKQPSSNLQ